jgi:exopolysaccharide biosynthesis polyprenyl glycosylphosphotransferase
MGELGTNDLWGSGTCDSPSQYARMIPGISAIPARRFAPKTAAFAKGVVAINEKVPASVQPRTLMQLLLPHPIADPFTLYQLVVADLIVLAAVCGLQKLLLPAWSLPQLDLPLFAVLVTLFGFSEGVYRNSLNPFPAGSVPGLARSVLFATTLVFVAESDAMVVRAIPTTFASSLAGLLLWRQLRQFAWARRSHDTESRRVLMVGGGPVARSIARALGHDPLERTVVQGFIDDNLPLSPTVLGRIADLDWLARAEFIDEVILALPGEPEQTREAAEVAFRNHLDIRAVPDLPPGPWPDAGVDYIGEVPVVTLHRESVPSAALFLKRLLDVAGAAFGLVFAGPVMAIVAFLIRLDSPGPVIYSAERTGAKGHRFRCYKFRSMVTNADHLKDDLRSQNQREGPIFKIVADPRITRVGRFIRRYSLDELPQLWNVLRGDMSLVGPRPHPLDDVNQYELHHYRRLDVKPGITGLWQITARHSPSFELNLHLDLTYIENWSLRLDLRILLSTVRVLFAPEGA